MKTVLASLVTFFNTARQALQFDLWTLTLLSGTVVRWTDADVDLSVFRSRASTATYIGSDGLLKTAAVNEPRFDYDPVTLQLKGLLVEGAATNKLLRSGELNVSPWNGSASAAPAGVYLFGSTTQFYEVAKTASGTSESRGQGFGAISAGYTCSVTIALLAGTVNLVSVGLYDSGGTTWGTAGNSTAVVISGPGTLTRYAGALWNINGLSTTVPTIVSITRTYTAIGVGVVYMYPGTPIANVIGNSILATRVQVEDGAIPTSYIPTTTTAVTRAADITQQFTRGPVVKRDRVKWVRGIEVDQLKVSLFGPTVQVDGNALPAFAAAGGLDGAAIQLERTYLNDSGVNQGSLVWFTGVAADVYPSRMGAELIVRGQLTQLSQQLPRNLYQSACLNDVYDASCAVAKASFTVTGTVTAVGSGYNPAITVSVPTALAARWAELGICKFTSGANNGLSRTVQAQPASGLSVTLQFSRPFPFPVSAGNTLTLRAGCDKTAATCLAKFNNLLRFRGQPYVPAPETVT